MFIDTIRGLEKVFHKDITPPKIILVVGPPGSLKSSFVYSLLTKYVKNTNEFGLYATLEETTESHLKNMESLGIEPNLNLQISDFTDFRDGDEEGGVDYLKFTEKMITYFKQTRGDNFTCFGMDSIGALYSLMPNLDDMRRSMFHFFRTLRSYNLISFMVIESSKSNNGFMLGNEGFLCDGIINLGLGRRQGRLIRYLQVEKMRAVEHSMEMHAIEIGNGGFTVLGPMFE